MSKPVFIAPATTVLQPKNIQLSTQPNVAARKPVVLVPLPVSRLASNKNFD